MAGTSQVSIREWLKSNGYTCIGRGSAPRSLHVVKQDELDIWRRKPRVVRERSAAGNPVVMHVTIPDEISDDELDEFIEG